MTAIEIYRFISENELEWSYNFRDNKPDVILFVEIYNLEGFHKVLPRCIFDDSGLECYMKDGYFCFWMEDILAYSGIELEEVFQKDKEVK